jgi:hypothetical protein
MSASDRVKEKCRPQALQPCPLQKGTLAVVLVRSDTGAPIKDATAAVSGPTPGTGATDPLGAVIFKDRTPGAYTARVTLPAPLRSYRMTQETPKGSVSANGTEVLLFKAAPIGNLYIDVYDDRGAIVTDQAELSASGPSKLSQGVKTGSHTFANVACGTYEAFASVPGALFEAPSVSQKGIAVLEGGTARVRLVVKRRVNVVTPKIEMEYKVVVLDRKLSAHQDASEKKILTDDVTYVRLSATQSTGAPSYTGHGTFEVSPANVEIYVDKECKNKLAGRKITNRDLIGGNFNLYLKANTKGKFTAKLTLDPANHPNIEVKTPAQEEMGVVELEMKVHWFVRSDLEAIKIDPDVEPDSKYHTALKDQKLPDQKALTDAQKVNAGRLLHVQKDDAHARAKAVVQKLASDQWPAGTDDYEITIDEERGGGSVKVFDKDWGGSEKTLTHKIKVKDLKAKEVELWIEGKDASKKLRDVVVDLGIDRAAGGLAKTPKRRGDWSRFTTVKIEDIKLEYKKAADEHAAWDETQKRYCININQKGDPDGRKITISARLSEKLSGIPVRFMLAPDKDNRKSANWNIDFPSDGKSGGTDVKWKDVPAALKHKHKADRKDLLHLMKETDKDGNAKMELQLSRFGGDKFHPGCYVEQDPHLAKYVNGHADLGKREPVFAKVRPIQVWRKVFYQTTRPPKTAMPASTGFDDSQRKVFIEPLVVQEKKMAATDFTVNPFRPDWQFNPGGTDDAKLCIGTHNVDDAMKLFVAATKATSPKFHVILCDEQFDAKNVATDATKVVFVDADNAAKDAVMQSSSVAARYLSIINPPLQGGALVVTATWQAKTKTGGAWTVTHSGTLAAANLQVRKDRASKATVRVTPPAQCGGAAGGCLHGGTPTALTIDATNAIVVTLTLQAADGGYNGWAPNGKPANVVKGGRANYAIHNTMAHELGHLFGKVRYSSIAGIPDHPLYYQKRGGSGTHCAFSATFNADGTAPDLDPTKANELDAQGKRAGTWDDGRCIIFGYSVDMKREWCKHCALDFIVSDLSKFG